MVCVLESGADSRWVQERNCRNKGGTVATNITAHITGTVWKIEKHVGDSVSAGDSVVILESMKMEMPVETPAAGKISEVRCAEGQAVEEGAVLAVVE
jgi:acetyl-CoA carboxylase biotin carboxyl carrier protein